MFAFAGNKTDQLNPGSANSVQLSIRMRSGQDVEKCACVGGLHDIQLVVVYDMVTGSVRTHEITDDPSSWHNTAHDWDPLNVSYLYPRHTLHTEQKDGL